MNDTVEEHDGTAEQRDEVVKKREAGVDAVLKELRRLVRENDMTQRDIEKENGLARGYLSQVLNGHMSLTARHVLAILFSLEVPPGSFFARLFPDPEGSVFGEPISSGYTSGLREPEWMLSEIRQRMARYDSVIEELEQKGLLRRDGEVSDRPPDDGEPPA